MYAAAPSPAAAPGPRWTIIVADYSHVVQVDTTRADVGRPHNLLWVRTTYAGETTVSNGRGEHAQAHVFTEEVKVHCRRHEIGWVEQTATDVSGGVTFHVAIPQDLAYLTKPEPDSQDEMILAAACAEPPTTKGVTDR